MHKREADFAGFLGEAFDLLKDNATFIAAYIALVGGLNSAVVALGLADPRGFGINYRAIEGFTSYGTDGAPYTIFVMIVTFVATYFLLAKLLQSRGRLIDNETRVFAYVGLVIISALGVIGGLVLLIVPGLILLVRWSAVSGFLIGRKRGIVESLGDSWDATRGYSWPIFGAGLVMLIISWMVKGIIVGLAGFGGMSSGFMLLNAITSAFGNTVFSALGIAIYYLLQNDEREVGEIFG